MERGLVLLQLQQAVPIFCAKGASASGRDLRLQSLGCVATQNPPSYSTIPNSPRFVCQVSVDRVDKVDGTRTVIFNP
jgi:hypothetical protein